MIEPSTIPGHSGTIEGSNIAIRVAKFCSARTVRRRVSRRDRAGVIEAGIVCQATARERALHIVVDSTLGLLPRWCSRTVRPSSIGSTFVTTASAESPWRPSGRPAMRSARPSIVLACDCCAHGHGAASPPRPSIRCTASATSWAARIWVTATVRSSVLKVREPGIAGCRRFSRHGRHRDLRLGRRCGDGRRIRGRRGLRPGQNARLAMCATSCAAAPRALA